MEANWNQLIERYLNNELSAEGKTAFETELKRNMELQQELELHQLTRELIQRNSLRTLVKQSGKWYKLKKNIIVSSIVLGSIAILALSAYLLTANNKLSEKKDQKETIEQNVSQNSETTTDDVDTIKFNLSGDLTPKSSSQLAKHLAFDNIKPQYFQHSGLSDVFLSESGVMFSLTDNSFLLDGQPYSGKAIVQWQEAQTPAEFAKAGLSTKAGNQLLETQGMFSLNAFTPDGKKLELSNEGAYIQVPVDEVKEGMKLFEGVPQSNGDVDWQNPVELERLPKQKSMSEMDLYPTKYEPKLNELKWSMDKKKRDSLYLSFENNQSNHSGRPISNVASNTIIENKNNTNSREVGESKEVHKLPIKIDAPKDKPNKSKPNGEYLFKTNCAACHSPNKEGTGPKLKGIREIWAQGGAKEGSIYQWVRNWEIAYEKDAYAQKVAKKKPTTMAKFPNLSNEEINAIFDYVDNYTENKPNTIPPSKVLTIWDKKFNGTNLATQDFEDRMKLIHETCDEKVLDVYINNLNEPLWKLDEQVVAMGYPQFQQFAAQRVGKVKIDDAHQKNLNAFYETAIKNIREIGKKNYETALQKEREWDNDLQNERNKEVMRKGMRESVNFQEEYNFNHRNVRKQLRVTIGFPMTNNIVNIDKYVLEATISRKTTEITNLFTGETGQITYNPLSAKVKNANQYDKLFIYLFSKEMNSYQRLDFENGKLDYRLNGDMNYSAAIIGMNENGYFYHQINSLKAEDLGMISLEKISEQEFDKRINALNNHRTEKPMNLTEELQWLFKEKANYEVQKQRKKDAEFRAMIRPTVFPCVGMEMDGTGNPMPFN